MKQEMVINKELFKEDDENEKVFFVEKHIGKVNCICYLSDMDYVLTGGDDCTINLYNKHGELRKKH